MFDNFLASSKNNLFYQEKKTFDGKNSILAHIFYLIKNLHGAGL